MRCVLLCLLVAWCAPLALIGCGANGKSALRLAGDTMGTTWRVVLPDVTDEVAPDALMRRIERKLAHINALMSTYVPDSELSRFNASRSTDWFDLSRDTYRVLAEAQRVHGLSDGAFDVTVGPAVRLWGFGPGQTGQRVPADAEISAISSRIGQRLLALRDEPPAVRKTHVDVDVDLSAIAKGYAVDEIAAMLDDLGLERYLVEIGGELRARGPSERGDPWRIAVEKPVAGERSVQKVLHLGDTGVATSGNYRNFFFHDARRYSHTIDPRTARPVDHGLASVTVLHASAMTADALATALTVLGPRDGLALAGRLGVAALFIVSEDGGLREFSSPAFQTRVSDS